MLWSILFLVLVFIVIFKLFLKWRTGWCESQMCLKGKTTIITGANVGIGYETALDFAKRGARVILACRNESKALAAQQQIIKETSNEDIIFKLVDFASLESVRKFAADINATETKLDILVNNAGLESAGEGNSEDGLQILMQINYFGPVLLTELLLGLLKKSSGRIVNLSSAVAKVAKIKNIDHLNHYAGRLQQYPLTKLCNILYTIELASRLKGTTTTTYSVHPGFVMTQFLRDIYSTIRWFIVMIPGQFAKDAREGAQTTIYCAIAQNIEELSGEHFENCHAIKRYSTADPELAHKVWNETKSILKL